MTRTTLVLALLLSALPLSSLHSQRITREIGLSAVGIFSEEAAVIGGLHLAVRPATRTRFALLVGAGHEAGDPVGRAEGTLQFLTAPARRQGVGLYAGVGLGAQIRKKTEARIIALVGLEGRPGGRSGWVLEGGVGGGWRAVAGWRWRRT